MHKIPLNVGISAGLDQTKGKAHLLITDFSFYLLNAHNAAVTKGQFSLISNHSHYFGRGLQSSFFVNVCGNGELVKEEIDPTFKGIQLSFLSNKVEGNTIGVQASSFNKSKGSFNGLQLGFKNRTFKYFNGLALGAINHARGYYGLQLGLLANISTFQSLGLQFSPFNYSAQSAMHGSKLIEHIQLGIFNFSAVNYGLQIGIINICKSHKSNALPIGIINIGASNKFLRITSDEIINSQMVLATGNKFVKNRLGFGYNYLYQQDFDWSISYGLELNHKTSMTNNFAVYNEFIFLHYRDEKWKNGRWVNRLGFIYEDLYTKFGIPLVMGLSFNASPKNQSESANISPVLFSSNHYDFWPGLILGLRF